MTTQEAIKMLVRIKDRINFEVTDSQKKMDALNMAIRSLEAWEKVKKDIKQWYWDADKQALRKDPCVVDGMIDLFIRTIDKHLKEAERPCEYMQYGECTYSETTIATVLMMSAMVLRDEFGFGRDRMNKFIDRFNKKTSCLVEGYVYWKDMQQTIAEETGLFIPLPDEFLDMGESE